MNDNDADDRKSFLHDPSVQLMLRVKAGDRSAFDQLFAAYHDRLVGVLTRLLPMRRRGTVQPKPGNRLVGVLTPDRRCQDLAEDVALDVFYRIYRARHKYEPTAKFSTWLFRIANNLASNMRREQGLAGDA